MLLEVELTGPFAEAFARLAEERGEIAAMVSAMLPEAQAAANNRTPIALAELPPSRLAVELLAYLLISISDPRKTTTALPALIGEISGRIEAFSDSDEEDIRSFLALPPSVNRTAVSQNFASLTAKILEEIMAAAALAFSETGET